MQVCAIIAEYNPFHNGHKYMIEQVRANGGTHIVAVMSGSFVQRGDVAICDKLSRAEMALKNGADLVIELPVTFAAATAQKFAHGAVALIKALGCVDTLSFGSECGNTRVLNELADAINNEQVIACMKENLSSGISFATARQMALEQCGFDGDILQNANDTLAVCYIDEINRQQANIGTMAIKRTGVNHDDDDTSDGFASASAIRKMLKNGEDPFEYMPDSAGEIIKGLIEKGRCPLDLGKLDMAIMAQLRSMSAEDIAKLPDISEGLENRIFSASREYGSTEKVAEAVKSKRYTLARIRRILLSSLIGVDRQLAALEPQYIRVLGLNSRGREILAAAKPTLPFITRAKDIAALSDQAKELFNAQVTADAIAALAAKTDLPCPDNVGVVIL